MLQDQKIKVDYNSDSQSFKVPLVKGMNHIFVSAWQKKEDDQVCEEKSELSSLRPLSSAPLDLTINCKGNECGKALKTEDATKDKEPNPYSNKYTRAIFGMEQAGASSSASESHPFIDFFFNAPLSKSRLGAWGDVRLTSTPQQIAAFVSSTKNTATAATDDKINDLATSFDFRLGTEVQFNPDNPRNRVSFITGFGATSLLTTPAQSAQIFRVPTDNTNSQFPNFFTDYPEAKGKTYIAFVRPERDRFLRQYFAGLRLKSYPEGDKFPSMLDVTFGQNSAVTGGQLRHFVLGIDGSYHLSLANRSLYIFGSTNLKFGGAKMVKTPYILDPVDSGITLTSPNLVITTRQMNRDVFRIGFGVDLVELFKDKPADKKTAQ